MTKLFYRALSLLQILILFIFKKSSHAFVGRGIIQKVQKDFQALTRRVTARHILVADEEIALALKRKIRDECIDKNVWIVDTFQRAAEKYSLDGTTNFRGGLLGKMVAQGFCRSQVLDRACFEVTLGELSGPIKSEFGYHLLLVTERTNCPKLDGQNTKLKQLSSDDPFGTLVPSNKEDGKIDIGTFVLNQLGFWFLVLLAGGLVAELAEKIASPIL